MQNFYPTDHLYVVVLCGGGGTRLWPLSRQASPKQFIPLLGDENLFRKTLARAKHLVSDDHIYIMTNKDYIDNIKQDAPEIPLENIIAEPAKKNTALAMGLIAGIIHHRDQDAVIINLASDHLITDLDEFTRIVLAGAKVANSKQNLVTVGIQPSFAHTGYGYIHSGEVVAELDNIKVYQVSGFREKPNLETATQYLKSGEYYWNANLYTWSSALILTEFSKLAPQLYQHIQTITQHLDQADFNQIFTHEYQSAPEEAIDTAISEKTDKLLVIPGDFGWTDIGSWNVVYDETKQDDQGNAFIARQQHSQWLRYQTQNTLVSVGNKTIATIGLDNIVIVDTPDALLVMRKDLAQDVKKIIKDLKATNQTKLL